jgi:integrase
MSAIFVHAVSEGICITDPAATVAKAMRPARKQTKQPAIAEIDALRELLRAVESSGASPVTTIGSRLLALTAVRPTVLRGASWSEFEGIDWTSVDPADAATPVWRVPSQRMKQVLDRKDDESNEHLVPLSRQAVESLAAIRPLTARFKLDAPRPAGRGSGIWGVPAAVRPVARSSSRFIGHSMELRDFQPANCRDL